MLVHTIRQTILHDSYGIIVENCWDVFGGELVCGVADEKACLADGTIADHNAPEWRQLIVALDSAIPELTL